MSQPEKLSSRGTWGGARAGAGRKKGGHNRTPPELLDALSEIRANLARLTEQRVVEHQNRRNERESLPAILRRVTENREASSPDRGPSRAEDVAPPSDRSVMSQSNVIPLPRPHLRKDPSAYRPQPDRGDDPDFWPTIDQDWIRLLIYHVLPTLPLSVIWECGAGAGNLVEPDAPGGA